MTCAGAKEKRGALEVPAVAAESRFWIIIDLSPNSTSVDLALVAPSMISCRRIFVHTRTCIIPVTSRRELARRSCLPIPRLD